MILISFIKRNILLYFRDRISVFFSLLSTLIVLTLMIAFLGQGNIDSTIQVLGTGLKYEAVHGIFAHHYLDHCRYPGCQCRKHFHDSGGNHGKR